MKLTTFLFLLSCLGLQAQPIAFGVNRGVGIPGPGFLASKVSTVSLQDAIPAYRLINWSNQVGLYTKPTRTVYTNLPIVSATVINEAIVNCPVDQIVVLSNQPYSISTPIVIKSGVTVRGQGTNTVLTPTGNHFVFSIQEPPSYTRIEIHSGSWRNSTNINLMTAISDVAANSLCMITASNDTSFVHPYGYEDGDSHPWAGDDPDSPAYARVRADISRVFSIANGTNIVIQNPLTSDYTNTPAQFQYQSTAAPAQIRENIGIENLAINTHTTSGGIVMDGVYNSWISNVHFRIFSGAQPAIFAYFNSSRILVQRCAFDGNTYEPSAIVVRNNCGSWLIEDNWFDKVKQAVVFVSRGNNHAVIGNYCRTLTNAAAEFVTHGAHKDYIYWAHNQGIGLRFDLIHGSSAHQVVFRNNFFGSLHSDNFGPIWVDQWNFSNSICGNVLGYPGMSGFSYEKSSPASAGDKTIFSWEYNGFDTSDQGGRFSKLSSIVHNNVTYETGTAVIRLDSSRTSTLTNCYYYGVNAPYWWDVSLPWPPIGPDVAGYTNMLPAQKRFLGL